MKILLLLAALLSASLAHAADIATVGPLTVSTSACVIAPSGGATCTGGVVLSTGVKSTIVENTHATADVWCDETSPAVVGQGVLLVAKGGSITFTGTSTLYCISSGAATLAVVSNY